MSSEQARDADTLDIGIWQGVHDGVMGGVSSGRVVAARDGLRFEGVISLENNGGFASVRRVIEQDLSSTRGVRLELRGDGRRYQFRLRPDDRPDAIAWRVHFDTGPDWQTLEFEWPDFEPVFRGRPVPQAGPVAPAEIRQIGFMLADGRAGPFGLEIRSLEFF
jgi:hypothetical protein